MKKKLHIFLSVIVIIFTLCSCSNSLEKEYTIKENDIDLIEADYVINDSTIDRIKNNITPYNELITKEIDIHYFAQKYATDELYGCENINVIASDIGIECLRKIDGRTLYSVHKVKQGGLLYIFYEIPSDDIDAKFFDIMQWFYVRESLRYDDFKDLIKNESTIDDIIAIDNAQQIFKNLYYVNREYWNNQYFPNSNFVDENGNYYKGVFNSWQYLEDGILEIAYRIVDGEIIYYDSFLIEDFNIRDSNSSYAPYCNACILDIDRISK